MAKADGLPWGTLADLTHAVRALLDPVLAGTNGRWDPQAWVWGGAEDDVGPENDPTRPPGGAR